MVLRGFLFEVGHAKARRQDLKWKGEFHLDHESVGLFKSAIYFLPLGELTDSSVEGRSFFGLYIQETAESQYSEVPTYARIGDCYRMQSGGDGFMLDTISWEQLLKAESPKEYGKELIIC
jgi:hypothetical protein